MPKKIPHREYFINQLRVISAAKPRSRYETKALEIRLDAVKIGLGILPAPTPPKDKATQGDGLTTLERMRRGKDELSNGQSSGS